ncbi:Sodium/calcium exchanger membrane region [Corchorus olitorius]|uniref:Sodium/calcium exchanger membrane region n=1 Tax=Corchorus olitorius TaxID=93759 RepID=A0A1R3JW86_9ROSI|nr:Sodium/calcium exchanger membrane region [Corchorus olitorius]
MAAVTLLALGNGAPDVFASLHAVRTGQYRTGFGAILSAGTFVSAFVVGFVAIYAAPFGVKPAPFIRDVLFYLIGALFLFYVYLSGEIFVWQAVGFVGFYLFFVGFVFWMDFGTEGEKEAKPVLEKEMVTEDCRLLDKDCEIGNVEMSLKADKEAFGVAGVYPMISKAWEVPISILLKLTIPQTSPSEWNRFYISANVALCPLALLYACNSFMPLDHPIVFLLPNTRFPLWFVVLLASFSLALLHFILEKEPPKSEQMPVVVVAFVMSVFWISTIAGELLNCLSALGSILKLPPALLGLTVLAWGNSVGDLVADVAVAKAGHPAMAMAGCFAGPMFNMLVGLGTALVMQTANVYPEAYQLRFHTGIIIAFVFLLLSLMGSLLVITWSRFRVPRFWGFCLVGLYSIFTLVSLIIALFSG